MIKRKAKPKPRADAVRIEVSPIPGLSVEQYKKLMKQLNDNPKPEINMAGKIDFCQPWVIDSGATEHIACNDSVLTNLKRSSDGVHVNIANSDGVPVEGIGSASLPSDLKVNNVLYIPNFKCSLPSISKITKNNNCFVTFFWDFCYVQDLHSRKLIGMGKCKNGLYKMEEVDARVKAMVVKVDT